MADTPISLQIRFDAAGIPQITQATAGVTSLNAALSRLNVTAGNTAALRAANAELNSFANVVNNKLGTALNFANQAFNGFYNVASRLVTLGLYKVTAEFIGLVYAAKQVSQAFLEINERFAGLQITLKSSFGSLNIATQLRKELLRLTPTSILPIADLESTFRSASVIPFTRSKIAEDAVAGNQKTIDSVVKLVEQLRIFRPDKGPEEAIFAIREALTGQFRSIIRRFDIPSSALSTASGKTLKELAQQPDEILKAMEKYFSNIITPAAVTEFRRQPSVLFAKLKEQLGSLPLLLIGDQGLYEKVTTSLGRFFDTVAKFVSTGIAPYTKRISDALSAAFSSITAIGGGTFEKILAKFGIGANQRPDLNGAERVAEGVTTGIEKLAAVLPGVLQKAADFFAKLLPILETVGKVALTLVNAFVEHPIIATAAFALKGAFASLIGSALSSLKDRLAASITTGIYESMTRSGTLLRAINSGQVTLGAGGGIRNAATGRFVANNFAPTNILNRVGGAAAGLGAGLAAAGTEIAVFAGAVAVFAAAAYGIEKTVNHFQEKSDSFDRKFAAQSEAGISSDFVNHALLQIKADVPELEKSRGAENLLRQINGQPQLSAAAGDINELVKLTTDVGADLLAIRDLLKNPNGDKTYRARSLFDKNGNPESYTSGAFNKKSSEAVDQLSVRFTDFLSKFITKFNFDSKGIRPGLAPEHPLVLTDLQQGEVTGLKESAEQLKDKAKLIERFFPDSLAKLNNQLSQLSIGDQLLGQLTAFQDTVSAEFDPNKKEGTLLGQMGEQFKKLTGILKTLDSFDISTTFEGSARAKTEIDKQVSAMKASAASDSSKAQALGPLIQELEKQSFDIFNTLLYKPISDIGKIRPSTNFATEEVASIQKQVTDSRQSLLAGMATVVLQEVKTLEASVKGASSVAESKALVDKFTSIKDNTEFFQSIGLDPNELNALLRGSAIGPVRRGGKSTGALGINPAGEGFQDTTQAQLFGQEGLAKFYQKLADALFNSIGSGGNGNDALKTILRSYDDTLDQVKNKNDQLRQQLEGDGFWKSFEHGFTDVTEQWRATILNMKTIGSEFATSFATDMGKAFSEFELGTKTAGAAFKDFAKSFLDTAVNLLNKKAVEGLLGILVNAGGSAVGGIFGGGASVGDNGGMTGNVLNLATHARGGLITSGRGGVDDVPAMLMRGEYVVPAKVVARYGSEAFQRLATGGVVGGGSVEGMGVTNNITIHVSGSESASATSSQDTLALARQLKAAVKQVLDNERRVGGSLRG